MVKSMARKLPSTLALHKKAYQTVAYQGVPMFRAQAWALLDYELHEGHLQVNSADRRKGVAEKYGHMSQAALYDCYMAALKTGVCPPHCHGNCNPANPPGFSSHELRSDGLKVFGPRGHKIPDYMLGIDAINVKSDRADEIVRWLNAHGYHAVKPYNTLAERHHFNFLTSPALHARKRLTKWLVTGK